MNLRDCVCEVRNQIITSDQIAGQENNAPQHCNIVHKSTRMLQAMQIPVGKVTVYKEFEKLEKLRRGI